MRWALLGDPLFREVGDEVFVLTRDSQMHWLKNESARYLWDRLVAAGASGASVPELSQALAETFEVDEAVALSDVSGFVEHLARHGVVTPAVRAPGGVDALVPDGGAEQRRASDAGRSQGRD